MNDRPDQTPAEDESPESAAVRRLLADARHTDPMPDDVAARMNRVLDRLGDETPAARAEPRVGNVIPIAAHRRRRAAQLLVAAAAIVVGGVTVSQVFSPSPDGGASAGSEAQTADNAPGGASAPSTANGDQPQQYSSNGNKSDVQKEGLRVRHGRVVIRSQHFTDDALTGRALLERSDSAAKAAQLSLLKDCAVGRERDAKVLAAEYQRAPAALLFRPPEGGSQVVDLFVCGSSTPTRTTTLPAP